jgi:hypothetical protein
MGTSAIPIEAGCLVLVELIDSTGEAEQRAFTLVASERADFKSGLLDESAPLGRALLGRFAGQTIPYRQGDLKEVRILSVERAEGSVSGEAAGKRRADVKKAEAQSEITNQMIFASASGSKWGDYEVNMDKLLEEQKNTEEKKNEEGKEE